MVQNTHIKIINYIYWIACGQPSKSNIIFLQGIDEVFFVGLTPQWYKGKDKLNVLYNVTSTTLMKFGSKEKMTNKMFSNYPFVQTFNFIFKYSFHEFRSIYSWLLTKISNFIFKI